MSTHIGEMKHLQEVVLMKGGRMDLHRDEEGRVDQIEVTGLRGFRDRCSTPLAVIESLRAVIGREASQPKILKSAGEQIFQFTQSQLEAYGGLEYMLTQQSYQNKIQPGGRFTSVVYNEGESPERYWKLENGKVCEFESKEDYLAHESTLTTKLQHYCFDISNPLEAEAFRDLYEKLRIDVGTENRQRFNYNPQNVKQRQYFEKLVALSGQEVALGTDYCYDNQWHLEATDIMESLEVHDWSQLNHANQNLKEGFYLEQTPDMDDFRRHMKKPQRDCSFDI
ncbi:hypothetical protein [Neptuniibacter sp. QD37_11]|uniref:hypothetical protein n=1 Tax=Neptuniibacter sp. QD37_11 TaxID=3398209 RepID=UPI0039F4C4D0